MSTGSGVTPVEVTIIVKTAEGNMQITQHQRINDRGHPEETRTDTLNRAVADAKKWLRSAR